MSVVTLSGSNRFLINQAALKRQEAFLKQYGAFGIEKVDGETIEPGELVNILSGSSLFSLNKFVVIKGLSKNAALVEPLTGILGSPPSDLELIIVEPKLDRRSKLFNLLKTKTEFKEFNELSEDSLINWIVDYAKENGGEISLANAQYLVDKVGFNQELLASELAKLIIFNPLVEQNSIDLLVEASPQSKIDDLIRAILNRDHQKVLRFYSEQRALKTDPLQIIGLLAWQLHLMALVKAAKGRSISELSRDAAIYPSAITKAKALSEKLTELELKQAIARLLKIDVKSKSTSINIDDALLYYCLSF